MDQEFDPQEVLSKVLIAGMDEAGKDFTASDLIVAEEPIVARAMQGGTGVLRPLLAESGAPGGASTLSARCRVSCRTLARTWSSSCWRVLASRRLTLGRAYIRTSLWTLYMSTIPSL